jgi:hypothetical protein
VQHYADIARRSAGLAQANALGERLRLIQALETALAAGNDAAGTDWAGRWAALAPIHGDYERVLQARFDDALNAFGSGREAYARLLEHNRERLLHDVLRLEIVAGIDSGAEFARERLKLQVEVLQSSLKSGQKQTSHTAQLRELCALPALADERTAHRIGQLFTRLAKEGK